VTTGKGSSLDKVSEKLDTINGWDEDGNLIANKIAGWEYDEETGTATIAGSININKNGTISATTNADSYLDLKQDYTELGYGDNKIHLDENGIGLEAGENTSTTVTDGKVETTVGNTTVTTTQDGTKFDNGESSTVIDGGNITTDNITTDNITTSTITAGNGNFTVDKDGNVTSGSVNGVQIGTNEKGDIIINGTDNNGEVIINGSNISSSTENIAGIDRVEDGENSTTVIENNTTIDNQGNLNTVNGNFEHQITVGGENGTLITNKDVTINKGTENEISLSQMGKVDNIDKELQSNSNYDGTVVGGLNAEANIRREQVSVLNNRVNSLENRIGNVEERIDKVGAMAAAIANLRTMGYDPEAPTEIAVGIGQYKSETGLALGVFHYPNEDFMLSASLSTSGDEVMGGIGATWKLGRKTEAEKAQDIETKRLKKAEEMKIAAQKSKVEAQKERHAKMLEERQNHKTA
ncbi:YadA C-terminal domain-containing protein, partial [Megamonas hypermegale]|uniref:YadA C-terminal domain-containing protein n=1 Tax=Megamonas hypermegale TaxID=158847 RepID=UPI001958C866